MGRQDAANALDKELMARLLPPAAVRALGDWLAGSGVRYAAGAGGHAVEYVPAHWSGVDPWPAGLAERSQTATARVSRAEAAASTRSAVERSEWSEALVAPYVWGQGRTGYGPHRLAEILQDPGVGVVLSDAGTALREKGAVEAYRLLRGTVKGLGPAFFTKFLYFLDLAGDAPAAPRALILDQRVARVIRSHATRVGLETGPSSAPGVAAWIWSDSGWTAHRYSVYLEWVHACSDQLAASGIGWPRSCPDLLELALFEGVWDPGT
ncbi:8-oxoguanine DNA glycosylase OGG fold protein [Streptomyces fructofermentans]|uniref:Uncharacterized protein n=1 Tax=Streptomyces fructofermentans TaxID=152141 RepID=A0A918U1U3_9ACTN|nr:hypothetical protein [Streptomyces fructofermentans]GGX80693.1 hypothetical protein GCM10010515_55530 [Streptomyces fructofermentans]